MFNINTLDSIGSLMKFPEDVSFLEKDRDAKQVGSDNFSELLLKSLGKVNNLSLDSDKMMQTMVTDPGKLNVHEVTNALSRAEMALSMAKAVSDRVINAYRDISNLR